ncbi:cilia- and flagella-associated protein 100 [Sorex fumeus]|uniref:cilia- and flagella-associated protein 100 n=1 Tax=Sorex fumeus TaxID=62283 RepID=UPI0024AC976C|nr:cilia- and flagella-associated protein 100 [Sorex fumeus]
MLQGDLRPAGWTLPEQVSGAPANLCSAQTFRMLSPALVLKEKPSDENIPESLDSFSASEEKKETNVGKRKGVKFVADRSSNPFYLSETMDVFSYREQEWKRIRAERIQKRSQSVQEKKTLSSKTLPKHSDLKRELQQQDRQDHEEMRAEAERQRTFQQNTLWKLLMTKEKKTESEDINKYIERKRQMFLLQYALDMKRNEIQRMEMLMSKEEEELVRAEKSLEKDASLFDEFLRDNDCSSVQALKVAEKETKAKMEKIIEIRDLTVQMLNIKSEMSKFEDTLQQYKVYKEFLYKLSPREWLEERKKKHPLVKLSREKIPSDAKAKVESKSGSLLQLDPAPLLLSADRKSSKRLLKRSQQPHSSLGKFTLQSNLSSPSSKSSQLDMKLSGSSTLHLPEERESDEEELDLYFTEPKQLLDIFVVLEEQNLSLIQNTQEMQETLDDLGFTMRNTRIRMDKEIKQLKEWMKTLMESINKEEEMAANLQLKARVFYYGEYKGGQEDRLLESLNRKVLSVYKHCIGSSQETNLGTLQMLTVIEHQLHELLENLERMPPSKVEQAEMAKEKERRQRAREEKIRQQKLQQEERLARFQARSQAEIKKKEGRRLVYRSKPLEVKAKEVAPQEWVDKEKEELLFFFT